MPNNRHVFLMDHSHKSAGETVENKGYSWAYYKLYREVWKETNMWLKSIADHVGLNKTVGKLF